MGQVNSPSAFTRVNIENGLTCAIWNSDCKVTPFRSSKVQTVMELGDFSWKRVVFQNPSGFGDSLRPTRGGLPNPTESTIGRIGLPPHSLLEPWWILMTQGWWCDFTTTLRHHETLVCVFYGIGWMKSFSLLGHSQCVPSCMFQLAIVWK